MLGDITEKKQLVYVISLIVLIIFSSSSMVIGVRAVAQVKVINYSSFIVAIGGQPVLFVVGEVQNARDQAVENVRIDTTFYNITDEVIATRDGARSYLDVILPDRRSPFMIFFPLVGYPTYEVPHNMSFSVSFDTTDLRPQNLRIVSHSSYLSNGELYIVGEVENMATVGATNVQVLATCYNESGTVINVRSVHTIPSDAEAGQKVPFEINVYDNNPKLISDYELTVESSEFEEIPEFNTCILLLLVLPLLAVIIYFHNRRYQGNL